MRPLPALKAVIYLASGITLGFWASPPVTPLLLILIPLFILGVIFSRRITGEIALAVSIIIAGAAAYRSSLPLSDFNPVRVNITARVIDPPVHIGGILRFPVGIQYIQLPTSRRPHVVGRGGKYNVIDGVINHDSTVGTANLADSVGKSLDATLENYRFPLRGKLWVTADERGSRIKPGQVYNFIGTLFPLARRRNPGDFNLKAWRERNGYLGEFGCDSAPVKLAENIPLAHRARNTIGKKIEKYAGANAPLMKALVLGLRRDIDPELASDLRATGLSHLLALSGLHVGFIAAMLLGLGVILRLPAPARYIPTLLGVAAFLALVPARGSTLRAGIIAISFLSGVVMRRWSPPLNSIGLAALVVLIIRPGDLFDAGFQLSFAAFTGIVLLFDCNRRLPAHMGQHWGPAKRAAVRGVLMPFAVSLAASVIVMPLTSAHFSTMALGAPLFNLAAVPLLSLIFAASWLMVAVSFIWQWGAGVIADGIAGLTAVWGFMVHSFASIAPVWQVRLAPISVGLCLASLLWLALGSGRMLSRAVITAVFLTAILVLDGAMPRPARFRAWFLDVGHGDAAVWLFPDGRTAVIDAGPNRGEALGNPVARLLRRYNRSRIDLLVASHPDADHIGGMIQLVDEFAIGAAICNPGGESSATFERLAEASERRGVVWTPVTDGARIEGLPSGAVVEVLAPPGRAAGLSDNDASVVLRLRIMGGSESRLLMTGDVERDGESALVLRGGIDAQLLKVPHHGSATSSSPEFIRAVGPQIAVISQAGWSESVRGAEGVLERYKSNVVLVYQTKDEGAIAFEPKPGGWRRVDWQKPSFGRWLVGWE